MEPVPITDILSRQSRLQELLIESNIELALIRQTADLYYYSGVIVDGFLALGHMGEALLLVRRPQHRLQELELPFPVAFYRDLKEIPGILTQLGLGLTAPLASKWMSCRLSFTAVSRKNCSPGAPSSTCQPSSANSACSRVPMK